MDSTLDPSLQDLLNWVKTAGSRSSGSSDVTTVSASTCQVKTPAQNARGAADDRYLDRVTPLNVNSVAVRGTKTEPKSPALMETFTWEDPADPVTVLRYGQTGGPKIASDQDVLDLAEKQAEALDRLVTKFAAAASQPAETNGPPPAVVDQSLDPLAATLGFTSKTAADQAAAAVIGEWQKHASDLADRWTCYSLGFTRAQELLEKAAADGSLAALLGAGAPPLDLAGLANALPPGAPPPNMTAPVPLPDRDADLPPQVMAAVNETSGELSPEEIVDQTLAGLMEATGMTPDQLKELIVRHLEAMGSPGQSPESPEGAKESSDRSTRIARLVKAAHVLDRLSDRARRLNRPPASPRNKAAEAHRARAREYFADLRKSVA